MLKPIDIKKLFSVLQAHYGHKWTTAYDDQEIMTIAISEWHRVLKGFRPDDLRHGIESWAGEWPPTLPEFARACIPEGFFGDTIHAEVQRRIPRYRFIAENAFEESKRADSAKKIHEAVIADSVVAALRDIAKRGVEPCMLENQEQRMIGNG